MEVAHGTVMRSARLGATLAFVCCLAFLGACRGGRPQSQLIRLGDLLPAPNLASRDIPLLGDAETQRATVDLDSRTFQSMDIAAVGSATMATLEWRIDGETKFDPNRRLLFALDPDGRQHSYSVPLGRSRYWSGRIAEIQVTAHGGRLRITGARADVQGTLYKPRTLEEVTMPSLPAEKRLSLPLPRRLAGQVVFSTSAGLPLELDRPGVEVRFRVWVKSSKGKTEWLDETLKGGTDGRQNGAWKEFRRAVSVPSAGSRVVLSATAHEGARPIAATGALWGDPMIQPSPSRAKGRNLVIVLIDTLRADAVGAYGNRDGLTPNIDRFARTSLQLDQALAPAPWTLPSIASLMTGLQPQTHGAGRRIGSTTVAPTGLARSFNTLADVLARHGFHTVGIYDNPLVSPDFGMERGYDRYAYLQAPARVLVDRAIARLRSLDHQRFFLYLHLFDVHNPYRPPAAECQSVARRLDPSYHGELGCFVNRSPKMPIPPAGDWGWIKALYKAEVAYTDREVGRFLSAIAHLGVGKNTVVLIVSDHGEEFWSREKQEKAYGYVANADHGHALYQDLIHVPVLLHIPGRSPAVIRRPTRMVDLFPTLLDSLGIEAPPNEGHDLLLHGADRKSSPQLEIAGFTLYGPSRWSVRSGRWKLILSRKGNLPRELYDLDKDPGELDNVAAEHPMLVRTLEARGRRELRRREAFRVHLLHGRDTTPATYVDPKKLAEIRALGYLQ